MKISLEIAISRIQDFYKSNKRVPSYKELTTMFGFASKNASFKLVQRLIEQDVLEKDTTGKIVPKNLFGIPHPELTRAAIATKSFKQIVEDLLNATNALAKAHPEPKSEDPFLRVIEATYRRSTFTLLAIAFLSQKTYLADSAMDLVRKMIEEMVSIEYMVANGKKEMAEKFQRFMWMQLHDNTEFLKTTGANFAAAGIAQQPEEIEQKYNEVKQEFIHRKTKTETIYMRSWAGKDIEAMMEELKQKGIMNDFDISRTAIAYVRACWKNHFNPYDLIAYLTNDLLEASTQEAMNHALLFGAICHYRLSSRYIDHIREVTGDKDQFEDIHLKIDEIWKRFNPDYIYGKEEKLVDID